MQDTHTPTECLVPLATAAMRLKVSWHRAWMWMLQGRLTGRRLETGRWAVTEQSLRRLEAERHHEPPAVA
jgi:predicted site-specific integrase-resolvase